MALLTKEFTLAQLVLSAPDCKTGADWGSNLVGYSDSFLIICWSQLSEMCFFSRNF